MNKTKILELIEKDFLTIANLEGSLQYAIKSGRNPQWQMRILHCAFKRACDIMLKRRKFIAKQLGLELKLLQDPPEKRKKPAKNPNSPDGESRVIGSIEP